MIILVSKTRSLIEQAAVNLCVAKLIALGAASKLLHCNERIVQAPQLLLPWLHILRILSS
jgi:hypothetical protein